VQDDSENVPHVSPIVVEADMVPIGDVAGSF